MTSPGTAAPTGTFRRELENPGRLFIHLCINLFRLFVYRFTATCHAWNSSRKSSNQIKFIKFWNTCSFCSLVSFSSWETFIGFIWSTLSILGETYTPPHTQTHTHAHTHILFFNVLDIVLGFFGFVLFSSRYSIRILKNDSASLENISNQESRLLKRHKELEKINFDVNFGSVLFSSHCFFES